MKLYLMVSKLFCLISFGIVLISSLISVDSVSKSDLSDYPHFFKNFDSLDFVIVIGENAQTKDVISSLTILKSLSEFANENKLLLPNIVALLDSEIDSVFDYNAIIVGGPCANTAASEFLDFPINCVSSFFPNEGKIFLKNENNKIQILVAGYDARDTLFASNSLSNFFKINLTGDNVVIRNSENYQISIN